MITVCVFSLSAFSEPIHIAINDDKASPHYGSLEIFGIDLTILEKIEKCSLNTGQWQLFWDIYIGNELPYSENDPSILGEYTIEHDVIRFKPKFGFTAGIGYTAFVDVGKLYALIHEPVENRATKITYTFQMAGEKKQSNAKVEKIFPTSDILPMNLLKVYIYFSEPMRRGQAYDHIRLFNVSTGIYEEDAFLAAPTELWDHEQKRLTLFFDPGRIKRDLAPNLQLGLPLKEGYQYRLEIDKDWKDVYGNSLTTSFEKNFIIGPADRVSPDEKKWTLTIPNAETSQPLVLKFNEPMDEALLNRLLTIYDNAGKEVEGSIQVDDHEQRWIYTPLKPWQYGNYQLKIDTRLEDLAGNDIMQLFDVDLNNLLYQKRDEKEVVLTFIAQ